jgi:hypothetical protein
VVSGEPLTVIVVNPDVEETTSTLNLSLTGIPDGNYSVRFINTANNSLSFTQNIDFLNNESSLVLSLAVGTVFEYFTVDGDAFGLSVTGVTV